MIKAIFSSYKGKRQIASTYMVDKVLSCIDLMIRAHKFNRSDIVLQNAKVKIPCGVAFY